MRLYLPLQTIYFSSIQIIYQIDQYCHGCLFLLNYLSCIQRLYFLPCGLSFAVVIDRYTTCMSIQEFWLRRRFSFLFIFHVELKFLKENYVWFILQQPWRHVFLVYCALHGGRKSMLRFTNCEIKKNKLLTRKK